MGTPAITATPEIRDRLAARLGDGWRRIDQAEAVGTDVAEWETFWITLLQEYQDVCRELDNLPAPDAISHVATPAVLEGQMTMGGLR